MISVTRLNGKTMIINALLIESIEQTPDTVITLTTGKKIMVREPGEEVVRLTQSYLQSIGLLRAQIQSLNTEGS